MVEKGDKVPDFTLKDQSGREVSLGDLLKGKALVLYFYPQDDTPGCTTEACAFRDQFEDFSDAGAAVAGISSDPVESHRRFAEKYGLPFTLLSDEGGEVRKAFDVPSTLGLMPGRVTYVIDRERKVRYIFNSQMNAKGHVKNALRIIKALR